MQTRKPDFNLLRGSVRELKATQRFDRRHPLFGARVTAVRRTEAAYEIDVLTDDFSRVRVRLDLHNGAKHIARGSAERGEAWQPMKPADEAALFQPLLERAQEESRLAEAQLTMHLPPVPGNDLAAAALRDKPLPFAWAALQRLAAAENVAVLERPAVDTSDAHNPLEEQGVDRLRRTLGYADAVVKVARRATARVGLSPVMAQRFVDAIELAMISRYPNVEDGAGTPKQEAAVRAKFIEAGLTPDQADHIIETSFRPGLQIVVAAWKAEQARVLRYLPPGLLRRVAAAFRDEAFNAAANEEPRSSVLKRQVALDSMRLPQSPATTKEEADQARFRSGYRGVSPDSPRYAEEVDALDQQYPAPLPRSRLAGLEVLPAGRHFDSATGRTTDRVVMKGQTANERVWVTCEPDGTCSIAFASRHKSDSWALPERREPITLGHLTKVVAALRAQPAVQGSEAAVAAFVPARDALMGAYVDELKALAPDATQVQREELRARYGMI